MQLNNLVPGWIVKDELSHLRTAVLAALLTFLTIWVVNQADTRWYYRDEWPADPASDLVSTAVPKYAKAYQFTGEDICFSNRLPIWEKHLAPYKGKPGLHYLEIGVAEGRSALWVLENILTHPTSRMTAIDPWADDITASMKERWLANVTVSGFADKVTTIVGYSQEELRKMPLNSVDIVYIDGDHMAGAVMEDAILSMRLVKEGGLIIFDDYLMMPERAAGSRPKIAIDLWSIFYGDNFDIIYKGYIFIVRKKAANDDKDKVTR
jgi:hypothetical protein